MSPFLANLGFHPRMEYCFSSNSNAPAVQNHLKHLEDLIPILKEELHLAQERMKFYSDKDRLDHTFKIGDQVWLLNRNIRSLRPSAKLDHKRLGPFKIINQINPVAFELDLPDTYRIHNAFHVSLLEPVSDQYLFNSSSPPTPTPVLDSEEYYVNQLLDIKYVDGKAFYLVNWYGYSEADNTWEPIECLTGCDDLLREFHSQRTPLHLSTLPTSSITPS